MPADKTTYATTIKRLPTKKNLAAFLRGNEDREFDPTDVGRCPIAAFLKEETGDSTLRVYFSQIEFNCCQYSVCDTMPTPQWVDEVQRAWYSRYRENGDCISTNELLEILEGEKP